MTTHPSTLNATYYSSSYGWRLKYLKCKYFAYFTIYAHFFFGETNIQIATNNFNGAHCNGYTSGINSPVAKYFAQSHPFNNGTAVTYVMEYDITSTYTSISNFNFRNGDRMVLSL